MAFAQKKQVRLNREGGIYSNSRRHSQLLRDYASAPRLHKGFGFSCSIETAAAKGLQKPESMHQ